MNRRRILNGLSWGACGAILVALLAMLDSYRRPLLEYGYGPERRHYFKATRERATELRDTGAYRVWPQEKWLLRGGWEAELSDGASPEALAFHRRARLVLPILVPEPLEIRLQVSPVPPEGQEAVPTELAYGVNEIELGRFVVAPGGAVLRIRVEPPMLHRGDNILYLYRVTRRSDPQPWLALRRIDARVVKNKTE